MKKIYIAAIAQENSDSGRKFYAYMIPIRTGTNLRYVFDQHNTSEVLHLCETKKQAHEVVKAWNEAYKRNGTYMFNTEPSF